MLFARHAKDSQVAGLLCVADVHRCMQNAIPDSGSVSLGRGTVAKTNGSMRLMAVLGSGIHYVVTDAKRESFGRGAKQ